MIVKKIIPKGICGESVLEANGARLGDRIVVRPMQGRKREILLNRRELEINSSFKMGATYENNCLSIPKGDDDFSFSLCLCEKEGKLGQDQFSRYLLKSNTNIPFKINGTLSFEAFIERGDVIDLSFNRIMVFKNTLYQALDQVENPRIVDSGLDILIEGETGTGKSRLAKEISQKSNPNGNFVHINLSAFSIGLIESELFGHVKGAFTGAVTGKRGAFLEARGGTLFLDEIDSLPWEIQTKLLLFLDNKEIRAVGGGSSEKIKVRMIFATGQNLKNLVREGKVRKDFYYRITSGIKISLNPLRKDTNLLIKICDDFSLNRNIFISPKLIEFYKKLSWPGNIRQLLGHLEKKAALIKGNKMEFNHFDEELLEDDSSVFNPEAGFVSLDDLKFQYVNKVFHYFNGNFTKSSKVLGISANTVKVLVNQYQFHYEAKMS
jgi:transcriptional regulator with PAS, ATPase and Fis domain